MMKIAVIGGGSTYTPEFVDGFARMQDPLRIDELWLRHRPRASPVVGAMVSGCSPGASPADVEVTDDLDRVVATPT